MSTLTIAYFLSDSFIGGGERNIELLVKALGARCRPLIVARPGPPAMLFRRICPCVEEWDPVQLSLRHPLGFLRQSVRLRRLLGAHRVQVVHANDFADLNACWLGARLAGCRIVVHAQSMKNAEDFNWKTRLAARRAGCAICLSAAVERNLHELMPGLRTCIIPSAVDREQFAAEAVADGLTRADLGLSNDHFVVGMASRIARDKEQDVLVRAAPAIRAQIPNVRFLLVGATAGAGAGYYERLKAMIAERSLADVFRFTGHVENVAAHMNLMDVFVLTGRTEAFGRVLIEAMALKKPIVAPDACGVPELIQHGVNGLLYPPSEPARLAQHIIGLHAHPAERERLGRRAYEICGARYGLAEHVAAMTGVYEAVLDRGAEHT
ncbi:MAG: glycosyltransferase family 4 protein [Kiritimatiellae bacterium]|nr:glycosyltransferase family 4 protein [Kiritimatiellia bacterium]